jgi:mannosyltransferase OCH1-like enzyme
MSQSSPVAKLPSNLVVEKLRFSDKPPLNILQTWKTLELIPEHYELVMKMRDLNPDANHLFFIDQNIEQFVIMYYPTYYETFKNFKYPIQRIDFFRYLVVYQYGGLYLDLDMDIVSNFDDLDRTKAIFPVETKDLESGNILVGNYAFYAPPFHPFVRHIINCIVNPTVTESEIMAAQKGHGDPKEHVYVYFTTGPELVTNAYHSYIGNDVILLEPEGEYRKDCFGKYGRHMSFGTWKN